MNDFISLYFCFILNFIFLVNSYKKHSPISFEESDSCYDINTKHAKRCIPNFENVAFKKIPIVSSTCGTPPIKYCTQYNHFHKNLTECSICDSKNETFSPSALHLTDLEKTKQTCWISAPVYDPFGISNLSITISFGKKYELTYISLEFCTQLKPDSLAIFKSMDHGKTWIPFQFYSSDCYNIYNRPLKAKVSQSNEQEAICSDSHLEFSNYNLNRIGFSTLDGRPSLHDFDQNPVLQDWVTATDIKIVFTRLLSPLIKNLNHNIVNESQYRLMKQNNKQSKELLTYIKNMGYFYTAVSEVAIGGRCKCNGHASRCLLNRDGKSQCDCKHNTAGVECERCLPFHYDRPWARGTTRDANECVVCNCNNHSNQCRFNKELYLISGRKSGGVCVNCKHNTAGRFCHYCVQGYYRNIAYSISDIKACQECNCHMIGSSGKVCNQNTGQCPCKIGVTGLKCDRCKKGYLQTNSAVIPCIKFRNVITLPSKNTTRVPLLHNNNYNKKSMAKTNRFIKKKCESCKENFKKLKLTDLCRSKLVILLQIKNKKKWIQNDLEIANFNSNELNLKNEFIKFSGKIISVLKKYSEIETKLKKNSHATIFFDKHFLKCNCPKITPFKNYLIIIKNLDLLKYSYDKNVSIDLASLFSKNKNWDSELSAKEWTNRKNFAIREWKFNNSRRVQAFLNQKCHKFLY